jgi:hypothetical protein
MIFIEAVIFVIVLKLSRRAIRKPISRLKSPSPMHSGETTSIDREWSPSRYVIRGLLKQSTITHGGDRSLKICHDISKDGTD